MRAAYPIHQNNCSNAKNERSDDENKLRFLTRAVVGTRQGVSTPQRIAHESSYQLLIMALYASIGYLGT